jgi:serine/threonine protein kinase
VQRAGPQAQSVNRKPAHTTPDDLGESPTTSNDPAPVGPAQRPHMPLQISTPTAFTPQSIPREAREQQMRDDQAREAAHRSVPPPVPGGRSVPPSHTGPQRIGGGAPAFTPAPQVVHHPTPIPPRSQPAGPAHPQVNPSGPPPLGHGPPPMPPMHQPHTPQNPMAPPLGISNPPPSSSQPQAQAPPHLGVIPTMQGLAPQGPPGSGVQPLAIRATDLLRDHRPAPFNVVRSRAYAFVLDARGQPIELGSGRFAKVYLGEERWLESKTDFRREVVIKVLQKGVGEDDQMRFQMEKELLERVQGHPNIIKLFTSGEGEDPQFFPPSIRDKLEPEFMILERLEMSLEERLKGSRGRAQKDDLLACNMHERVFRVLDYMIPIASAVEFAHLVKNVCHRDIKPANVLVGLPDPKLRGSTLEVRLTDFNVAKLHDEEMSIGMTQMKAVPGTLFFQSPEQETNVIELLVNVQQGSPEVEFFEDFYIQIAKNDNFSIFNRNESYPILYADRARKRIVLARPFREVSETNVRAKIQKSVGRPADIYSLGAMLYYLMSGAYANPKTLYDAFHKFIEYERADENNTIEGYLAHEYSVINSLRAPKQDGQQVAPADRFFSYKHYLDGNGELIDPNVMRIIAKCMIRNKPDSYCQAHDIETKGISELVADLIELYSLYGVHPAARPMHLARAHSQRRGALAAMGNRMRWWWLSFLSIFRGKK